MPLKWLSRREREDGRNGVSSPSRWHKLSCKSPHVVIDEATKYPRCKACKSVFSAPQLEQLISQHRVSTEQPWSPPPDKPLGEWNLSWPPSVRYTAGSQPPPDRQNTVSVLEVARIENKSVYERNLGSSEIRLMNISPAQQKDYPLHASLEIWEHQYCPEYETASYTWGGEDDDSRRLFPIYIGRYWDVLLQTRNCLSMLRYVRQKRGFRTMWVDAICINQDHDMERKTQVSKMGDIYQKCLRVVVYLGDDIIKETSEVYRPRQPLNDILADLLKRRYFGRVWIVQELILAPCLVIPIGEIDYLAQGLTSSRLPNDWSKTAAPWLANMGHGANFRKLKITEALRQTWNSTSATDQRDKIFGVLGLVDYDTNGNPRNRLVPEYSVSFIEAFIGICGYILTTLSDPIILLTCWRCRSQFVSLPSWVPDLKSTWIWNPEPSFPYPKFEFLLDDHDPIFMIYSKNIRNLDLLSAYRRIPTKVPWNQSISIDASTGALSIEMIHLMTLSGLKIGRSEKNTHAGLRNFQVFGGTVCIHFCTADIPLSRAKNCQDIFLMETGLKDDMLLFFTKRNVSKDSHIIVFSCRCYVIFLSVPEDLRAEDLREDDPQSGDPLGLREDRFFSKKVGVPEISLNLGIDLPDLIDTTIHLGLYSVADIKALYFENLDREFTRGRNSNGTKIYQHWKKYPSSGLTARDVLPLLQAILDEETIRDGMKGRAFEQKCLTFFQLHFGKFEPSIEEGAIVLRYTDSQFREHQGNQKERNENPHKFYTTKEYVHFADRWQIRRSRGSKWSFLYELADKEEIEWEGEPWLFQIALELKASELVFVRAPLASIRDRVTRTKLFEGLCFLSQFRESVGESELEMALSDMKSIYGSTQVSRWPESAKRELGFDYSLQTITII